MIKRETRLYWVMFCAYQKHIQIWCAGKHFLSTILLFKIFESWNRPAIQCSCASNQTISSIETQLMINCLSFHL